MNEYIIEKGFAYIVIHSAKHGDFMAKINLDDADRCKAYRWGINKYRKAPYAYKYYVYSNNKIEGTLLLHRFITGAKRGEYVDHINRDTLDNTRNNLQICDISNNEMNSDISINNISGCKGVMWCAKLKTPKYKAYIMIRYKYKHLGYFNNYEDAVKARQDAESAYFLLENKQRKVE